MIRAHVVGCNVHEYTANTSRQSCENGKKTKKNKQTNRVNAELLLIEFFFQRIMSEKWHC